MILTNKVHLVKMKFQLIAYLLSFAVAAPPAADVPHLQKRSEETYVASIKASDLSNTIEELEFLGANVNSFEFSNGFAGIILSNPTEEELSFVQEVGEVILDKDAELHFSWGLDRINQNNLPLDGDYDYSPFDGEDVNVYVIDTGIDVTNPDFGGRATFVENLTGDGIDDDCHGHGTHVAGTIGSDTYGIAKKANLFAYKVFSCTGGAPFSRIISAINKATDHAVASGKRSVINMSLGGGYYKPVNDAVEASVADGVHNVVSAGNSNADACGFSPASAPSAVTVASSTSTDFRSSFSNWGTCVDIFAPGSSITSWDDSENPWTISGTSMAAPHVAGVMALKLAEEAFTPAQMESELISTSAKGKISDVNGSPNDLLNIEDSDFPTPTSTSTVIPSTVTTSTSTVTPTESPGLCNSRDNGEQYCLDNDTYITCVWGSASTSDVAPGTKCCDWSAAKRVLMVGSGVPCPF